jgi:hypothetical protein
MRFTAATLDPMYLLMVETKMWIFLGLMAVAAAAIPFVARRLKRQGAVQTDRAFESLDSLGHVIEEALSQQGSRHLRIWGVLDHPVATDLRIAFRSGPLARVGGRSGGLLDPLFDRSFRVVTKEPERARLIVDPEIQHRLARLGKLEFRLGSFHSLLPPEYGLRESDRSTRRLRRLWMIRVPKLRAKKPLPAAELAEVGQLLAQRVAAHCRQPGSPDLSDFETGRAEGQWL